jgi:hypothetical protein
MYSSKSTAAKLLLSLLLFTVVFALGIFSKSAKAQTQNKPVYVAVNYVKVNPGMGNQYRELLSTYIKKINEEHIKAGRILGWYTHTVLYPTGSSANYDMTIVTVSNELGLLIEDPVNFRTRLKNILPGANDNTLDNIVNSIGACRTLYKREIYTFIDGINMSSAPSAYVEVDFMKSAPGKGAEYVKMEREVFKPLHADLVKQGKRDDWGLYALDMPYSDAGEYNYLTANFFANTGQMTSVNYDETFKKLFPKLDMNATWNQMSALRKIVRSELWKLGVFADGTNTK